MHKDTYEEILEFLSKWGAFLAYVSIGLLGKFGFDIVTKKHISFWYVFGTSCVAFCICFLSWGWCTQHTNFNPGIIVPFASLISRDVMLFVTVIDWRYAVSKIFKLDMKKDDSDS
jgi:hypothetical protein